MKSAHLPLEDRPATAPIVVGSGLLLATLAQHIWDDPLLNVLVALLPLLAVVAMAALRPTEEDWFEENPEVPYTLTRAAVTVATVAYLSAFIALAAPAHYAWLAIPVLCCPLAYIGFRLADLWAKLRNERPERYMVDIPTPVHETDAYVERGAREAQLFTLIASRQNRR